MKRLSLALALAAVVCILGAPLVVLTGCTPSTNETAWQQQSGLPAAGAPSTSDSLKTVSISYNDSTKAVTVVPETVIISRRARQQVVWRCSDGDVQIHFPKPKDGKGGTPFAAHAFVLPRGGGALSGPVRDAAGLGNYKYLVIVTIPGKTLSEQPYALDPEVQVDP